MSQCLKCRHARHIGECPREIEVQGIQQQCACITATPRSLDKRQLRQDDAAQQRQVDEALGDPRRIGRPNRNPPRL